MEDGLGLERSMLTRTLVDVRILWAIVMLSCLVGCPIEFARERIMFWLQQWYGSPINLI